MKRFIQDNWLALMLGLAALAALLHLPLARLDGPRAPESVPEYLPEPPDDAPPAIAYGLANEGEDSDNTVLATLLDLVDRGYYETKESTTDDEKLDLAIKAKGQAERPTTELTAYEQEVLEFFDQLLDGKEVALSDMKDKVPKHSDLWRGRWERMTEKIDAADDGQIGWDRNFNPLRYGLIIVMVALQVIVALFHAADDDGSLIFPLGLAALTFFVLAALPTRGSSASIAPTWIAARAGELSRTGQRTSHASRTTHRRRLSCGSESSSTAWPSAPPTA